MAIGATATGAGFNELLSLTAQKLEGPLRDQVMQSHPTLDIFKGVVAAGEGPNVMVPVRGALLGKTAVSDAVGTFSTALDGEVAGIAKYEFSNPVITPTSVAFMQQALNEGSNKVADLVKTHLEAAADDHGVAIAASLYGGTIGGSAAGWNSLPTIVDDTAVVGGIDPATSAWWKSSVVDYTAGGFTDIRIAFRRLLDAVVDASSKQPTILIAGADVFNAYEESLDDAVRYNALGTGETRFTELKFAGMTIRRDGQDCPADEAYLINQSTLIARHLASHFMKVLPAQQVQGTLTSVTPVSTILTFGTSERRAHGKLVSFA